MTFRLPDKNEIERTAPELIGLTKESRLLFGYNHYWLFKEARNTPDEFCRDMLGYILGKEFCNVAEVKGLSNEEFDEIKSILNLTYSFNPLTQYLVRVANTYSLSELLWKTA